MRTLIAILSVVLLVPTLASAAYNRAEVLRNESLSSGTTKYTVRFTGNAGEEIVDREYVIGPTTTPANLRNWVDLVLNELNGTQSVRALLSLSPGTVIPRLAPVTPPTPAKDVWQRKVADYAQFCTRSFTGQIATDCATEKSDIEATYQAGFLDAQ